jgi:hypothetical protein
MAKCIRERRAFAKGVHDQAIITSLLNKVCT